MSDELDQLRELRPQVPAPAPQVRQAALEQLRAAALRETTTGQSPSRPAARWRSRRLPNLGLAASLAASVAVVVAVGAIALLAHTRDGTGTGAGHGAAVRGEIVAQGGNVLADSRAVFDVEIDLAKLPPSATARAELYRRLALIVGTSTKAKTCPAAGHPDQRLARIPCAVAVRRAQHSTAPVTAAAGVPARVSREIAARAHELPGVTARRVYQRVYPGAGLAAQVLGTVGPINATEVRAKFDPGTTPQSIVGQSGLEAQYNQFLQAGDTLHTSLDQPLQQAGQQALAHAIATNPSATGGAYVAMNPDTGAVYAMGSLPTYNRSIFSRDLSSATYRKLTRPQSGAPLLDRAIQSAGPTGSAFTPITALAALQSNAWKPNQTFDDTGQFCVGSGGAQQCRHNSGHAVDGQLNVVDALKVSSDDFFYNLGARTNANPSVDPNGGALDLWARAFGIGRATGIDLPNASAGTLPTPAWRQARNRLEQQCDGATGPFKGRRTHRPGGCGIADGTDRPWSIGDNESLAVGQGDVQVSPLQLAVAYSAIANGGTIVRPHIGAAITAPDGATLQTISPSPERHLAINPQNLAAVRNGLRAAASQPGGTSEDVFGSFDHPVHGHVGTAQYNRVADYAWYAGYVPASASSKPITIVAWVNQGGFGDVSAAPVARQLFSKWLNGTKGPWVTGSSTNL